MPKLTPNALGSLYMTIGSLGYVINDGLVRRITEEGPGVYQVLCMRSIGIAVLFAVVGRARGEHTRRSHMTGAVSLRVVAETVGAALFFAAIVQIEFANAQAILLVVPFAVTLAAAVVLKERVTAQQYVVVAIGFIGVVIVVRPASDAFSVWSLVVLASALAIVVRELATRDVSAEIPALSIAFVTAVGLAILTGGLSISDGWHPLSWQILGLLVGSTLSLSIGYVFTIQTVRIGDLSVTAPFRYTVLVGAVVVGYLLFDEVPDRLTVIGSAVIIATGIYAVRLERVLRE